MSQSGVLKMLKSHDPQVNWDASHLKLVHKGKYANAYIYRYKDAALDIMIKDFTPCIWWFRMTLGRYYVGRECKVLQTLDGVNGVAGDCARLGPYTFCYNHICGYPLISLESGQKLPREFFIRWEKLVRSMRKRNIAHLDSRNLANVLVGDDGYPYLIDFQSAMRLGGLPRCIKRIMILTDYSAVYKGWKNYGEVPMGEKRQSFMEKFQQMRRFWVIKGYPLKRLWAWVRGKEYRPRKK